ncbi:hypothetical protein [Pseudomonas lutea]|uniref:Uncharacterized protein n=1 Tax=Pseudomonas lutea TaxID=243924 RepID=A0A9X0EGZ0_9PSED|nr:hypothetical protein [Pseudomonas lutea]KGF65588.1 hypothetical protein LT42_06610 [Pseudomonas lutea]
MANVREIALEQALIAVLGAVQDMGIDVNEVSQKAGSLVLGHSKYRQVEHPHVSNAHQEIDQARDAVMAKALTE